MTRGAFKVDVAVDAVVGPLQTCSRPLQAGIPGLSKIGWMRDIL